MTKLKDQIIALLPSIPEKLALVGVRTVPSTINEYDDRLVLVIDNNIHSVYMFNTEPSTKRKGIATLVAGKKYWYKTGIHGLSKPPSRRYPAFVQASPVLVQREGEGLDSGFFGINIHRGSNTTTSSLGCQTLPPTDESWDRFQPKMYELLDRFDIEKFPYYLFESNNVNIGALNGVFSSKMATPYVYIFDGKDISDFGFQKKMVAGRGFVKARAFASFLLRIKPEEVPFTWVEDDLYLNNIAIDLVDESESVTWGSIANIANACGYVCIVNKEKQQVHITKEK